MALVGIDHGKKEKDGGREYVLSSPWTPAGRNTTPLEPNSRFIECNDGWFQAYDHFKNKLHFRVGAETIKEIFQ